MLSLVRSDGLFIRGYIAGADGVVGVVADGINVRIYSLIVNVSTMRSKAVSVSEPRAINNTSMSTI